MDEINFNASLDALLDSEHLGGGISPSQDPFMGVSVQTPAPVTAIDHHRHQLQNQQHQQHHQQHQIQCQQQAQQPQQQPPQQSMYPQLQTIASVPSQGLLTSNGAPTPTPSGVPYVQYAITQNNLPGQTPDMTSPVPVGLPQPPTAPIIVQQHQPQMQMQQMQPHAQAQTHTQMQSMPQHQQQMHQQLPMQQQPQQHQQQHLQGHPTHPPQTGLLESEFSAGYGFPPMQPASTQGTVVAMTPMPHQGGFEPTSTPLQQTATMPSTVSVSSRSVKKRGSRSGGSVASSHKSAKSRGTHMSKSSSAMSVSSSSSSRKRSRNSLVEVPEEEGGHVRKRQDRNFREQQRAHKITHQIAELRVVLESANIQFKPDKYSTLVTVAEYIKQLQNKSASLDQEHKKLLDTISTTNDLVNQRYLPSTTTTNSSISGSSDMEPNNPQSSSDATSSVAAAAATPLAEAADELLQVSGVDYKSIFTHCGIPLAIASVDGRFMDCNREFENLTGISRSVLLPEEAANMPNSASIGDLSGHPDMVSSSPTYEQEPQPNQHQHSVAQGASSTAARVNPTNLSLFNLLCREDMDNVFTAMSNILQKPGREESQSVDPQTAASTIAEDDFWSGIVRFSRNPDQKIRLNVALVRSSHGRAKFFDYALTPVHDE